jgi:hypothetical protein
MTMKNREVVAPFRRRISQLQDGPVAGFVIQQIGVYGQGFVQVEGQEELPGFVHQDGLTVIGKEVELHGELSIQHTGTGQHALEFPASRLTLFMHANI